MTTILRSISAGLVCVSLAWGCGPSYNYVGHWKGQASSIHGLPDADPVVVKAEKDVDLMIDSSGHFKIFSGGLPRSGDVSESGKRATLSIKQVVTRRVEGTPDQEPDLTLTPTGPDSLDLTDSLVQTEPIHLQRVAKS